MYYIRVDKAPEELKANEMVLYKPNFAKEVAVNKGKRGVQKTATIRNLRDTLMTITDKFDKTINPYHIKLQKYDNLMYDTDEDYGKIILRIIKDNNLNLLDKAVEFALLKRPAVVDTVYYVSPDLEGSSAFIGLGFSMKNNKKVLKSTSKKKGVV